MKTRIENVKILTMDGDNRVYEDGCVLVDPAVGSWVEMEEESDKTELCALLAGVFPAVKQGERFQMFLRDCISYGEEKGLFVRSVSDRISLA